MICLAVKASSHQKWPQKQQNTHKTRERALIKHLQQNQNININPAGLNANNYDNHCIRKLSK